MLRYAITDRHLFAGDEAARQGALLDQALRLSARGAPSCGADLLQIREKDLSGRDLELLAQNVIDAVRPSDLRILLNGPAHTAVAVRAHGLHLRSGATDEDVERARQTFAVAGLPPPVLSLSVHSVHELQGAPEVDYILFGPIFEKRVRGELVRPGLGLSCLHEASALARASTLIALGGIDETNASLCIEAGAAGVAGIRLFLEATAALPPRPPPSF